MKKLLKNIGNGEYFGCWGDQFLNYNSPVWVICQKESDSNAREVRKDGNLGTRFSIGNSEEVNYYGSWEIAKEHFDR